MFIATACGIGQVHAVSHLKFPLRVDAALVSVWMPSSRQLEILTSYRVLRGLRESETRKTRCFPRREPQSASYLDVCSKDSVQVRWCSSSAAVFRNPTAVHHEPQKNECNRRCKRLCFCGRQRVSRMWWPYLRHTCTCGRG